jgi:integrase/recombinase XerD
VNLYLSDHRFQVGGQRYADFPILVDSAGKIVEVALRFFVDRLLRSGSARDPKTWKAYGQHLYDYFGFLEAKNLRWDVMPSWNSGDVPALAHYVKWCDASVGNSPRLHQRQAGNDQAVL